MLIVSEYISSKRTRTLAYPRVVGDVEHSRSMKDTFAEGLLHDRVWGRRGMHGSFPTLGIGYLTGEKGQQVAVTEAISMPAEVCSQHRALPSSWIWSLSGEVIFTQPFMGRIRKSLLAASWAEHSRE